MSSIFNEQIVKRDEKNIVLIKRLLIAVAAAALCAILYLIPMFFAALFPAVPALFFVVAVAAVIFWRNCDVEFEYYVGDSDLDISKIYGKSKRKNIDSINLRSIKEIYVEKRDVRSLKREFTTVYDCTGGDERALAISYNGSGESGNCIMLFSPNEKIISAMKLSVPASAWKND